jgi:putative intracellular protease/amidase
MSVTGRQILVPLPDHDFDVTEVAVPWKLLTEAGYSVIFATEQGHVPAADQLLLKGVLFGRLGAEPEPRAFYADMIASPEFTSPIAWDQVEVEQFDGLILAGGHAPGMRQYLGSGTLQTKVAEFWSLQRPVGAICHGVLVLARASDNDGRSLLHESQSTCLPKYLERSAFWSTFWKLGRYYRTYPKYVETEIREAMADPARQFKRGPIEMSRRGTREDNRHAFVVRDGRYISARWPGDAYLFAKGFIELLSESST